MPDVSPTKWHLAHTTWFFETFILKKFVPGYRAEIPEYAYRFNSYYNAAGDMHRRDLRGLISRPTVTQAQRYRASIDSHIDDLLSNADDSVLGEIEPILVLGIHHEQQHQELLLTDIKHVLAQNPLNPVFRAGKAPQSMRAEDRTTIECRSYRFIDFEETVTAIGHDGDGFAYDNEGPRHQALVPAFSLATVPVTNGEYIAFIEDNGYSRPEFWLSLGCMTVNEQRWNAPLYWTKQDGAWWNFTLSGLRPVDQSEPVTHVSYFEADAYANWAGARLPTEFEWERAALDCPVEGNFVEDQTLVRVANPRALFCCDPVIGEHDFSSFCRLPSDDVSLIRRVHDARWLDTGEGVLRFEIEASAFCHQMVRSLVGTMVDIGRGRKRAGDLAGILRAQDRSVASQPAPPHGLCLWGVLY